MNISKAINAYEQRHDEGFFPKTNYDKLLNRKRKNRNKTIEKGQTELRKNKKEMEEQRERTTVFL